MALRILCINPWIYDFSAYDFWNQPIGLLSIAAWLRNSGHQIDYLDCLDPFHPGMQGHPLIPPPKRRNTGDGKYARERIPRPACLKFFPRHYYRYGITPIRFDQDLASLPRPDLILLTSMMTYWYPGVIATISHLRRVFPDSPLVLGGHYVTLCPEHARRSGADFCLAGPAEQSLPALIRELTGEAVDTPSQREDLDAYPYPAFDLIRQPVQVPLLTSRGCPYRCSYCASHLTYGPFRQRDPGRVVDEILHWHAHLGIRHFSFYDDALLARSQDMAIPLLQAIIAQRLPLSFHCPNGLHLREVTPQVARLMFQAGFRTIRFGFETSDCLRQRETGGKVTNDLLQQAVAYLREAGYQGREIGIYLLCGLPGQGAEEVEQSIRFVQSVGALPVMAEFSPIPGTALWPQSMALSPYPLAEEPLFHNNSLLPLSHPMFTHNDYRQLKQLCRCQTVA